MTKMRTVPLSDARPGDTVTLVGEVRNVANGSAYIAVGGAEGHSFGLQMDAPGGITVTRSVPKVPDNSGELICVFLEYQGQPWCRNGVTTGDGKVCFAPAVDGFTTAGEGESATGPVITGIEVYTEDGTLKAGGAR